MDTTACRSASTVDKTSPRGSTSSATSGDVSVVTPVELPADPLPTDVHPVLDRPRPSSWVPIPERSQLQHLLLHQWLQMFAFPDITQDLRHHCAVCGQWLANIRSIKLLQACASHSVYPMVSHCGPDCGKHGQIVSPCAVSAHSKSPARISIAKPALLWQARIAALLHHDRGPDRRGKADLRESAGEEGPRGSSPRQKHGPVQGAEDSTGPTAGMQGQERQRRIQDTFQRQLQAQQGPSGERAHHADGQTAAAAVLTLRSDGAPECMLPALFKVAAEWRCKFDLKQPSLTRSLRHTLILLLLQQLRERLLGVECRTAPSSRSRWSSHCRTIFRSWFGLANLMLIAALHLPWTSRL